MQPANADIFIQVAVNGDGIKIESEKTSTKVEKLIINWT